MNNAYPNPMQVNRGYGELMFTKMMAEEVEKGHSPGSIFNKQHQLDVYRKFRAIFGPIFSDRVLRSRFKQLKKRYHDFSEVLNHESVFWNKKTNIVEGNEELLKKHCKRNRMYNGKYHGEENYDLLCKIFESGVKFE